MNTVALVSFTFGGAESAVNQAFDRSGPVRATDARSAGNLDVDEVDRSDVTVSEPFDVADDEMSVVDVLERAVLGFVVLAVGLSLLGGVGAMLVFDGAIGDAETDFVAWVADNRVGVLDSVATFGSTLSDTWTVVGAVSMLWVSGHGRHGATILLAVLLEFTTFLVAGAVIGRARPDVETPHSVPSTPSFPRDISARKR